MASLLSGLELAGDADTLREAVDAYRDALDNAESLKVFRGDLATALTRALPTPVKTEDVRVVSEADIVDDPLSGVTVTVKEGNDDVRLSEQSDGIRALAVLMLLGMSHKTARIVAVDEPENHLHPLAQRAVAGTLRGGVAQSVIVTHSPSVVALMDPMDLVAFRSDRKAHQLPNGSSIATYETTVRHWSQRLIEPLTAYRVVLVEGVSDRILVRRVAALTGVDLDRLGISVFELDGGGLFGLAYELFGPSGFAIPVFGLCDTDYAANWARAIGVTELQLPSVGIITCTPDLEGEYVNRLGVATVVTMLLGSGNVSEARLKGACGVANVSDITADGLARFCSNDKVLAALAVAAALTAGQAASLVPLTDVLGKAKTP
jgi:putative ATP-dependent endonuclease of OLD family